MKHTANIILNDWKALSLRPGTGQGCPLSSLLLSVLPEAQQVQWWMDRWMEGQNEKWKERRKGGGKEEGRKENTHINSKVRSTTAFSYRWHDCLHRKSQQIYKNASESVSLLSKVKRYKDNFKKTGKKLLYFCILINNKCWVKKYYNI